VIVKSWRGGLHVRFVDSIGIERKRISVQWTHGIRRGDEFGKEAGHAGKLHNTEKRSIQWNPHHPDDFEGIRVLYFPRAEVVVKTEALCHGQVSKMHVSAFQLALLTDLGQGEVVRCDQSDGPALNEQTDDGFGGNAPVGGIRTSEKFVDEKKNGRSDAAQSNIALSRSTSA